jgi:hypothetical protein
MNKSYLVLKGYTYVLHRERCLGSIFMVWHSVLFQVDAFRTPRYKELMRNVCVLRDGLRVYNIIVRGNGRNLVRAP